MADKREINGVFMIPFGLAAGFTDGNEIRLIELAENGFCFRTEKELGRVESFRICFYGGSEVLVEAFELEMRIDDSIGIPVFVYSVFVDQQEYRECAAKLILQYDRYVRLKLECEDGELAKVLTGYPAELDTEFAEDLEEQKKEWFGEEGFVEACPGKGCFGEIRSEEARCGEALFTKTGKTAVEETKAAFEYAVELDRPELYERYLSMEFCDFMSWYWRRNQAEGLGKQLPAPTRIYVGNAFCHLLFPEKELLFKLLEKAAQDNLAVTITTSYLREFMLEPVENLLDQLTGWCKARKSTLEIVANDWGMLKLLNQRGEFLHPCMGILLNKRKKDPRMRYKQGDKVFLRENSLNAEFYRKYLLDTFGIRRYEWESCGYEQEFPEGKNSIHVPFYQTNSSQYCTLYAVCKNKERGRQELPGSCIGYCGNKVFLYPKHLKLLGRYNSLFALDENAVSGLTDPKMWKNQGIDRVVVNLL